MTHIMIIMFMQLLAAITIIVTVKMITCRRNGMKRKKKRLEKEFVR